MAQQPDGTIYIDTKIGTQGFEAGGKEIEAMARRMAKTVSGIGAAAEVAVQKQVNSFVKQNQAYAAQEQKIDELRAKIAEMKEQKVETKEHSEIVKEIEKTEAALDRAIEKQIKFVETGGNRDSRVFAAMEYDIENLNEKLDEARAKKKALEESGGAYKGIDTSGAEQNLAGEEEKLRQMNFALQTSFDSLRGKIEKYRLSAASLSGLKTKFNKILKSTVKLLSGAGAAMLGLNKKTKGTNNTFKVGLKNILRYGIGVRSLFALINKMRRAVVEGFQNLAQYSERTNASISSLMSGLTQLKNSLATAFAPILNAIAPALRVMIDLLSRAATYVSMFIAALTGQKTFEKAVAVQQDYRDSLNGTASAAKKAKKETDNYLSGLDEVRRFETPDEISGAGAGAGLSAKDMFDTVPIENSILNLVKKVKQIFSEMFAPLKAAWNKYGRSIKSTLGVILQDFLDFGARIGNAAYQWFKDLNWEPLISSIDILLQKLEPLINTILEGLAWAWENVLLPFGKWTIEEGLPAAIELLGSAFEFLNAVLIALEPVFTWLWNNALLPLSKMVGDIAIGIMTALSGLLEFLTGVFTGDWEEAFSGLEKIAEGFRIALFSIIDFIQNSIFSPFDKWLQGVFSKDWSVTFGVIGAGLNAFFAIVKSIWNGVKGVLQGIITFIKGVFTGDWRQAWEGVKQIFKGVWDTFAKIVKAPINVVIGILNSFLTAIQTMQNAIASALNKIHIDIPGRLQSLTGMESFEFNIGYWTAPKIPYLATGAVIPPNAPFMAMLGDQKSGNNIEAPENLIRKIIREEMAGLRQGGGSYAFTAQINRRTLFEEFIEEAKLRQMQTGRSPFEGLV